MKRWRKYENYLLKGDWHVHTNYTDGKNTVFEYCEQAEKNGLELIAFTEHVRRDLNYNFDDFLADVYAAKDRFDLEVLVGCEAKVLDCKGTLDVFDKVLKKCEIVLGTFHRFKPVEKNAYLIALKNMLSNPDVDIWAHPTLFAKKKGLLLNFNEIEDCIKKCIQNNILIEKNIKYKLPNEKFMKIVENIKAKIVIGSDAHNIFELRKL